MKSNRLRYSDDVYEENNVTAVKKNVWDMSKKSRNSAAYLKENNDLGGKGRLTDAMIDNFQNYYGIATRTNSKDTDAMKKAV